MEIQQQQQQNKETAIVQQQEDGTGDKPKMFYKGRYGYQFACNAIEKFGFERLEDGDVRRQNMWSLWMLPSKYLKPNKSLIRRMERWQKFGRYPGANQMTKKDKLWINIQSMKSRMCANEHHDGAALDFDFLPQTFVLPKQWRSFRQACKEDDRKAKSTAGNAALSRDNETVVGPWIVKPTDKGCGQGIYLVARKSELKKKVSSVALSAKHKHVVVSRYIDNPLLIDGFKFDLRFYVLVTSFSPLRIFFYNEGLGRFCTEKYQAPANESSTLLAHLTNTSLNCKSGTFHVSEDPGVQNQGHLWAWSAVASLLASHGVDVDMLMKRIYDLTIKTIASVQDEVLASMHKYNVPSKDNCFQLFGLDVMVDDTLKPWLMEVNGNPCLEPFCSMETTIKAKLIGDMLRVLGFVNRKKDKAVNSDVPLSPAEQMEATKAMMEYRNRGDFKMIYPSFKDQEYDPILLASRSAAPPPHLGFPAQRCLVINRAVMGNINAHHDEHKSKKRQRRVLRKQLAAQPFQATTPL